MVFFSASIIIYPMANKKATMVLKKILSNLFRALIIVLVIVTAYQIIKAIIGGTWATENIIIAGMGIILAGMFVIVGFLINQGNMLGRLDERTKNIGNSLSKLGEDFKQHLEKK